MLYPVILCLSITAGICFVLLALPLALRIWVHFRVRDRIFNLGQAIPESEAAIVLGAALWADGSPTPVLYDRVATGVALIKTGLVKKLVMSGDGRSSSYNEPDAMQDLAIELGVAGDSILLDHAGLRTYDSLLRALKIHGLTHVTIVTQQFHMDRALYLADAIGLRALGVLADRRRYRFLALQRSRVREVIATTKAWLDIHFLHPNNSRLDDVKEIP